MSVCLYIQILLFPNFTTHFPASRRGGKCWWLLKGKHIMLEHTNLLTFTWKLVPWKKQSEWTLFGQVEILYAIYSIYAYTYIFLSIYKTEHTYFCVHTYSHAYTLYICSKDREMRKERKVIVSRLCSKSIGVAKTFSSSSSFSSYFYFPSFASHTHAYTHILPYLKSTHEKVQWDFSEEGMVVVWPVHQSKKMCNAKLDVGCRKICM